MNFEKDLKKIDKLILQKERQLLSLKDKIIERWPEDLYGVTWMEKFNHQSQKLIVDIRNLEKKRNVILQYIEHYKAGDINC